MDRRRMIRFSAVMIALAVLLPFAALADACDDCREGGVPGCCPPACSLCLCCGASPTEISVSPRVDCDPVTLSRVADPSESACRSFDPRDVFHVPKLS